jgi:purine-cytosine permease-like protein
VDEQQTAAPLESDRRSEDRRSTRSLGGRRQAPRRATDRAKLLRDMAALVFALCGGLAVVYLFFAAFGAIDIGEAVTASVIALALGFVWMFGFGYRLRSQAFRAQRGDRERRGF